jgi:(p)ppGpp synthase/HD superfamily hydrolase
VHDGHLRKGTQVAYLSHLMSVSALVMENGVNEDEAIAALLHDAIEDRGNAYDSPFLVEPRTGRAALKRDIELQFGTEVLSIVRQCTDKLHNARVILADYETEGERLWQRFNVKAKAGQLWSYEGLADAFAERSRVLGDAGLQRLARQLAATVAAIGRHQAQA